ncbi:LOW QUALITY PROTEIN: hypothetical protein CRUP_023655 [Coryphaenoides rupestris]|nr:LOW QUALITY PROTEIN: hypothetical protein CRUP_023655 [Coryphaenoides rupestris]
MYYAGQISMGDKETILDDKRTKSRTTVVLLFFFLLFLVLLLLFLYRRLNKKTNGQYTVRNMVLGEGGLRDGLAHAAFTHLGIRLWADRDSVEAERRSDNESEEAEEGEEGRRWRRGWGEEEEEGGVEEAPVLKGREGDEEADASVHDDDLVTLQIDELPSASETSKLIVVVATVEEVKKKDEEEEEEEEEEEQDQEQQQGAGLLIDLKKFSGGAMWAEEGTVTIL